MILLRKPTTTLLVGLILKHTEMEKVKVPRKKEKSFIELLMELPWWITFLGAVISFIILKFIVPAIDFEQKNSLDMFFIILNSLKNLSPILAPFVGFIFLISSVFSFLRSSNNGNKKIRSAFISNDFYTPSATKKNIPNPTPLSPKTSDPELNPLKTEIEREDFSNFTDLSITTLKRIEWYSFEKFSKIFFECLGYKVIRTQSGADGGVDLIIFAKNSETPRALVQCKARTKKDIGVSYLRELLGVMTIEKVAKGILITNSSFTKSAVDFADKSDIEIIDLYKLHTMIEDLESAKKALLQEFLNSTDFKTPTCPNCEVKLVERTSKKGKSIGDKFWGCVNFPRCRYTMKVATGIEFDG